MEEKGTNAKQSKYQYTASLMDEALVLLLSKKEFELITIKEICAKAGVNRSTFYLHYENTTDLLNECLDNLNHEFYSSCYQNKKLNVNSESLDDLILIKKEYLIPYLEFVKSHRSLFKAVYNQPYVFQSDAVFNKMFENIFNPILNRFGFAKKDNEYIIEYYIKGVISPVMKWANNGCEEDVEHIEKLIEECTGQYLKKTEIK